MASHSLDIEEEGEYVDCSSPHSESTYETESPEACGGGYPTPEDETMACCYSVRSQELDPEHIVTCTFSVSLALPLAIQTPKRWSRQETQRTSPPKTREGFIPKMHRFYHIEYFLLPDDTDPRKLDLVLLGSLARLYLETESRAVKPWLENDQIWVSWSHSIEINVTNEFLIKLRDHNIQLRLWDLKEKVCSKARFGKQKPAVPHSDHDFEGELGPNPRSIKNLKKKNFSDERVSKQVLRNHWSHTLRGGGGAGEVPDLAQSEDLNSRRRLQQIEKPLLSSPAPLPGERYVASQLKEKSFKLFDAYLSFSVDNALMTEKQKRELNPLIIRIKSARGLPATPVPIEVLQSSCVPVYCKYKFHNMPPHQTQGRDHGTEVFFKDMNVILIGTLKPEELSEYLRGPPLEIEVHDRDKKMEAIKTKPSLFGEEPGDSKLSNLSFSNINFRYMLQSSFSEEIWHPYGVARISLVDLLLGEKTLNFIVPIQNCSVQDTAVCQGENIAEKDRGGDGSQVIQLPMGHYVNAESHLKVRVEITVPLSPEDELDDSETSHCPYGCIIYIFDYKNTSLLSYLLEEITKINAEALQLDSYPLPIILRSLNTLKLDHKLPYEDVSQLDIITGFHILDGSIHLLVLEGLKNKGLKKLWNKKIDRLQEAKRGRLQIFYNSQLSFHQRLYTDLEAIVFHIRLCKSLTSIMKHPLLYIRDMVPQPCFEALVRLACFWISNILPVPLSPPPSLFPSPLPLPPPTSLTLPLSFVNPQKLYRISSCFFQGNIENLNLFNKMMRREVPQTIRAFPSDGKSIFNYSCQALNSAEITKNLLRVEMAKVPGQRFAYSHNYISAIFAPVDEDIARKASMEQSRKQWLSPEGFVCAGFKSSIESNSLKIVKKVREKWQENFFNAGRLKPVLDRERWSWDKRNDDFELYKKPPLPALYGRQPPPSPKLPFCY
uniref:Cilia and flagella associated protein 92 (putative) n=1 Tax=Anolis carolinensis TaxID=28377 RepID=G1KN91_ANOCA